MKYIILIIGLLVVGCGKQEQTDTNESTPTTTEKPVKELTAEEKVVGEYEHKRGEDTYRVVLLENGIAERYINGKKDEREFKWKITKEGELHYTYSNGYIMVYRINKDGSLTPIADISKFGKREEAPKEAQLTFKKIKSESKGTSSKGDDNNSTTSKPVTDTNATKLTAEEKVIGEYELIISPQNAGRLVFLENGIVEAYLNGNKDEREYKREITKEGELHVTEHNDGGIGVFRINEDRSITLIARIDADGKREEAPKEDQETFKKIK